MSHERWWEKLLLTQWHIKETVNFYTHRWIHYWWTQVWSERATASPQWQNTVAGGSHKTNGHPTVQEKPHKMLTVLIVDPDPSLVSKTVYKAFSFRTPQRARPRTPDRHYRLTLHVITVVCLFAKSCICHACLQQQTVKLLTKLHKLQVIHMMMKFERMFSTQGLSKTQRSQDVCHQFTPARSTCCQGLSKTQRSQDVCHQFTPARSTCCQGLSKTQRSQDVCHQFTPARSTCCLSETNNNNCLIEMIIFLLLISNHRVYMQKFCHSHLRVIFGASRSVIWHKNNQK